MIISIGKSLKYFMVAWSTTQNIESIFHNSFLTFECGVSQ